MEKKTGLYEKTVFDSDAPFCRRREMRTFFMSDAEQLWKCGLGADFPQGGSGRLDPASFRGR